jgi:hypothetical protein
MPIPGQASVQLSGALPDDKLRSWVSLSAGPNGEFGLTLGAPRGIDIGGTAKGDSTVVLYGKGSAFPRVSLAIDVKGLPSLSLFGKDDFLPRAELSLDDKDRPSFSLYDSDLKTRAVLGNTGLEPTKTGSNEETVPSSLVLFDKTGHVIWRTP